MTLLSSRITMSERSETQIKREIEIDDEFCALTETLTRGEVVTGDIKPVIPEYYGIQMYETSPKLSALISQSNDNVSLSLRCRLCAMPNNDMVDIFSSIETEETILDKVRKSLPIVIEESDGLPKRACRSCLATLELCYQFHQTVVQAERQLLALDRFASGRLSETDTNSDSFPVCGGQRVPTEDHNIDTSLKTTSNIETSNNKWTFLSGGNQAARVTINSNGLSSSLRPCSVVIPIMEACWKNNAAIKDRSSSSSDNARKNLDSTTELLLPGRIISASTNQRSPFHSGVHVNSPDIHMPAHVGERRYTCDTCAKTFKRKYDLNRHSQIHKNQGLRLHQCNTCAKTFKWKSRLNRHNLVHSEKHYTCKYCEKKFSSRGKKEYHHRRIHLKKRPFKCLLCEKSFVNPSELKRHAIAHSKDRNYHCSLCDKSFKTLKVKNGHMEVHTSIKQWQCSYCKRSFRRKYDLRTHFVICKKRY